MADPHALPGFGQVDLDLGDESDDAPPASASRTQAQELPEDAPRPAYTRTRPPGQGATDKAATRMGSLEEVLSAAGVDPSAGSESGIATRDERVAAMREAYARGDVDGALELADSVRKDEIASTPEVPVVEGTVQVNVGSITETAPEVDAVRSLLTLTERQSIPRVRLPPGEIANLPIDPRGGFLLAQVDGMQTLEEILDVCAMPSEEALEVIEQLKSLGVIEFD
jgi:hypothetical protein